MSDPDPGRLLDLACSAAGQAVRMLASRYWDFAAGGLVATEAGARLGGLDGKPASPEMTIAAEPGLFGALHALLADLDPERDAPG